MQPTKKYERETPWAISTFSVSTNEYRKNDEHQKAFLEDLIFLIAKGYYPLRSVENMWLRQFALHRDLCVVFPFCKSLIEDVLYAMVEQTLDTFVWLALSACCTVNAMIDLLMSKGDLKNICTN